MSRRVVELINCDLCGGPIEEGAPARLLALDGAAVELDLDEPCGKGLDDALDGFLSHGRPVKAPARPATAPQSAAGNFPCPDCTRVLGSPQGLGLHRKHQHGYVSQNPEAVRKRERRAAEQAAAERVPA